MATASLLKNSGLEPITEGATRGLVRRLPAGYPPEESQESLVWADPPGRFDTLETWEQWLKELRETVPDAAFNKQALIEEAEWVIAEKRGTPISRSAPSRRGASKLERVIHSLAQQHREL